MFLRVDAVAPVLEDDRVYVLDAGDLRKKALHAYSWAGPGAGRVERALAEEMADAGFGNINVTPLSGGVVWQHSGWRV